MLQNNGTPVPPSLFTAPNTVELVQEVTGTVPVNVEVVTDREVVNDLDETILAVGDAQQLQGSLIWGCHVTNVTCLLSGREGVMNIVHDHETARQQL